MPEYPTCPVCGGRCRIARDRKAGTCRLVALQDRRLLLRIEKLEAALLRVRAAVKAEAKGRGRRPGPGR